MTKFNTGNPVGSSDPRDLFDNAAVADKLVTGDAAAYNDRLGKSRKSWQGIESEFAAFIAAGGYVGTGTNGAVENYAAGIEIAGYNQIVRDASGEFWRLSGPISLPYTTTGAGLPEGGAFVAVGDAALRQELNGPPSSGRGAALVKGATIYAGSVAEVENLSFEAGVNVYLTEDAKSGDFVFDESDLSSEVDADKKQLEYIAPASDPSGASGAWAFRSERFPDNFAPAYLKTVSDMLNGLPVSILRFFDRGEYAAIKNYTSSADLSARMQEAIDAFADLGGGELYFPGGLYNGCVVLKSGVSLLGAESHPSSNTGAARRVILAGVDGGYDAVVDTLSTENTEGSSIKGFLIQGLGAGVDLKGAIIRGGRKNFIKDCAFNAIAKEAIFQPTAGDPAWAAGTTVNGTLEISKVFAQNCLLGNVTAMTGVIHLNGTDGGLDWVEATASLGALSSVSRYKNAFYFGPESADYDGNRLLGEFADSGFYIAGIRNRFGTLKSDNAFGHGAVIDGADVEIAFLHSHRASQETDGGYNGIEVTNNARRLVLPGWRVNKRPGTVNRVQHAINETLSNTDLQQKNNYGSEYSAPTADRTGLLFSSSSLFGGSYFKHNQEMPIQIADGDATPSVNEGTFFEYKTGTAVSVTDFDDATPGQTITVVAGGAGGGQLTIENNANIKTKSGANVLLASNDTMRLKNYQGTWIEI